MKRSNNFYIDEVKLEKPVENIVNVEYNPFLKSYAVFDGLVLLFILCGIFGFANITITIMCICYACIRIGELILWYRGQKNKNLKTNL
jgi:hypothetical protein